MMGLDGLRRAGFEADADRVSKKFLALVAKEFEEHGTIVEKYDVQRRESDVEAGIKFGYAANQIGFGWTNAAFLDLLAGLEGRRQPKVATSRASRDVRLGFGHKMARVRLPLEEARWSCRVSPVDEAYGSNRDSIACPRPSSTAATSRMY
jgi:hypothetical protein